MLRPEKLFCPVPRQVLHHITELASTVVALAGISLGVLVGEYRAHRLEDSFADKILRSDQLQSFVLPPHLVINGSRDRRIHFRQRPVHHVCRSAFHGCLSPSFSLAQNSFLLPGSRSLLFGREDPGHPSAAAENSLISSQQISGLPRVRSRRSSRHGADDGLPRRACSTTHPESEMPRAHPSVERQASAHSHRCGRGSVRLRVRKSHWPPALPAPYSR